MRLRLETDEDRDAAVEVLQLLETADAVAPGWMGDALDIQRLIDRLNAAIDRYEVWSNAAD